MSNEMARADVVTINCQRQRPQMLSKGVDYGEHTHRKTYYCEVDYR